MWRGKKPGSRQSCTRAGTSGQSPETLGKHVASLGSHDYLGEAVSSPIFSKQSQEPPRNMPVRVLWLWPLRISGVQWAECLYQAM